MATVYKIELTFVSHWMNYTEDEIKSMFYHMIYELDSKEEINNCNNLHISCGDFFVKKVR